MSMKRNCYECNSKSVTVKPLSLVLSLHCDTCAARYEYSKSYKEMHRLYSGIIGFGTIFIGLLTRDTVLTTLMFISLLIATFFLDLLFSYKSKLQLIGLKGIRKRLREKNS